MDSNNYKTPKKKKSLFFSIIKFTFCLIIIGIAIYYVVPSTTNKKEQYVSIAKKLMDNVSGLIENDNIKVKDTNTTYYIPANCVNFKDELKTPYGEFEKAYIIVTYNGDKYKYYWTSVDNSNYGVPTIKAYKELSFDDIKSNVDISDIKTNISIDNKKNIVVFNDNCSSSEKTMAYSFYDTLKNTVSEKKIIEFANQQTEGLISVGDELVIGGKEHFYVVSSNNEETILLAKYNLYVGYKTSKNDDSSYKVINKISKNDKEYGMQSSKTLTEGVGVVPFASYDYWNSEPIYSQYLYNGSIYNSGMSQAEPNILEFKDNLDDNIIIAKENNYTIAYYIESYIELLEKYGLEVIEGRLLTADEASGLGCSKETNCLWYKYDWLKNTNFWLGSLEWNDNYNNYINTIDQEGNYYSETYESVTKNGVRPVIIIKTSDIMY